jgi:hypothetical protein
MIAQIQLTDNPGEHRLIQSVLFVTRCASLRARASVVTSFAVSMCRGHP